MRISGVSHQSLIGGLFAVAHFIAVAFHRFQSRHVLYIRVIQLLKTECCRASKLSEQARRYQQVWSRLLKPAL